MVKLNLIANYLGTGWSALMGLAFLPIYIHYVGIEAYGLIGVFASLQAWFMLLDMGLSPTLNREMARFTAGLHTPQSIQDLLRTMELVYLGVAIFLAVFVAGFSSWIAADWLKVQTLSIETVSQALTITGLIISCRWMGTLYRSAIMGLQNQVWLNSVSASFSTIRGVGSIAVLAFVAPTIQVFFLFQAIAVAVETGVLGWKIHRSLPRSPQAPQFSMDALRSIWHFAAGMTMLTLLNTLITQIDKVLLSTLLPLKEFGYFVLATTVASAISLLAGPILNVATPRFTELVAANDQKKLIASYHMFAQLLTIIIIPASLVLFFFSREILLLWTRDAAMSQAVAPIVSVWVIGTALSGLMYVPYTAQLAYGWTGLAAITGSIAVVVTIPAFLILVPRYGVMAAAWIWVGVNSGYMLFGISAMHTRILKREKWEWYGRDIFWPFLVGLSFALVAATLSRQYTGTNRLTDTILLSGSSILILLATATVTQLGRKVMIQTTNGIIAKMI